MNKIVFHFFVAPFYLYRNKKCSMIANVKNSKLASKIIQVRRILFNILYKKKIRKDQLPVNGTQQ